MKMLINTSHILKKSIEDARRKTKYIIKLFKSIHAQFGRGYYMNKSFFLTIIQNNIGKCIYLCTSNITKYQIKVITLTSFSKVQFNQYQVFKIKKRFVNK